MSTDQQEANGSSLDSQRAAITAEAERRGWQLLGIAEEIGSGSTADTRERLQETLSQLAAGEADVLVVSRLDRLTRSLLDFAKLVEQAEREGWSFVALDQGFDLTQPIGRLLAGILASFAEYERNMIRQRTREGLARKRAQGVHTGRRSTLPAGVRRRIRRERNEGRTWQEIADGLNADRIPTGQGGAKWWAASVRAAAMAADVAGENT